MSRLALTPTNVPAFASAPTVPTLRAGDLYFDTTTTTLMIYDGTQWIPSNYTNVTAIDGGVFDSIAPYQGGFPSESATQTFNGGTP